MGSGDALQFSGRQTKPTLLLKGQSVFTDCLLLLLDQQMNELGQWATLADHGVTSMGMKDVHVVSSLFSVSMQFNSPGLTLRLCCHLVLWKK